MNHKVILYVDVLVKFRNEPVALAGDVSQMYHQILADQWTGTFIDSCTSPWAVRIQQRFMILRGLFLEGVTVHFASSLLARLHKENYPLAANAVLEHCYMDDLMPLAPTVDEAKETTNQLTELDDSAGSHIRKWISNEPDVIADVAEEERASDVDLEKRALPTTKTLGVLWVATGY